MNNNMKIYTYKNKNFQISFCEIKRKYEVLDLNAVNIFGAGGFKSINEALKDIKIYIDLIK